ncbi:uncharacterized protein LOC144101388 [Amblyomma americanum]
MHSLLAPAVVVLCTAPGVLGKLGAPGGPQKLPREVPDSFKVISDFPYSVAISDSDNDTMFECLAANRTDIDYEAQTATFVWTLQETDHSPKQEVPFYVRPGETPGTMDMVVGDDPTHVEGIFYFENEDCVVMDLEYKGHQCILWTRLELKDSVPQACIDHFVDTCGVVPPPHSRDLCPDGEGDY